MPSVCFYIFFSSMQSNKKDTFESNETPFTLVSSFEPRGDQPEAIRPNCRKFRGGCGVPDSFGSYGLW